MNDGRTISSATCITVWLDDVIGHLRGGDRNGQAVLHARLLLTDLTCLLRPIPDAMPAVHCGAEQVGFGVNRVRQLKYSVIRGIREIELDQRSAAKEIFAFARDSWSAESFTP